MSGKLGPDIVTDGLVLCLDAADKRSYPGSGNTWYDLSGNNNDALKAGSQSPEYPLWNSNGYFIFSGGVIGNNYSRFEAVIPALNEITIEAFHYSTNTNGHIIRANNDNYQIGPDGYTAGTSYADIQCSILRLTNIWLYDSLTFNGTVLIGYRNGNQYSSNTRESYTGIAASTARIGARSDAYAAHYEGNISIIRIYNRVLSASEIQQNYKMMKGRYNL